MSDISLLVNSKVQDKVEIHLPITFCTNTSVGDTRVIIFRTAQHIEYFVLNRLEVSSAHSHYYNIIIVGRAPLNVDLIFFWNFILFNVCCIFNQINASIIDVQNQNCFDL